MLHFNEMIRHQWKGMSKAQRCLAALALALVVAVLRWACLARITHDEGYMFDAIAHFPETHVMQVVYNGYWGNRWVVTIGPTVSVPLGLLAYVFGTPVVLDRLIVYFTFCALFALACRTAKLPLRVSLSAAALFLLWVLCMVWRPDINGSSINLIANIFGEGHAFAFALLANLLSVDEDLSKRRWTWICAALAVGSKLLAILAVAYPCATLLARARTKRSLREIGLDGLLAAVLLVAGWNAFVAYNVGWDSYVEDWKGLFFWLRDGGGYNSTEKGVITLMKKADQLRDSHVSPYLLLTMTAIPVALLAWIRRRGWLFARRKALLAQDQVTMLLCSIGIFYFWYLFVAARGWMRHLWIGYALLGWLVCVLVSLALERAKEVWPVVAGFAGTMLVISLFWGTLPALGPLGPTEVWTTQEQLAEALSKTYPSSRLMVIDWHMVPHISFFMQRPQYDALEFKPHPGDLFLCDTESACDKAILKYCQPRMTVARVAYCQYQGGS